MAQKLSERTALPSSMLDTDLVHFVRGGVSYKGTGLDVTQGAMGLVALASFPASGDYYGQVVTIAETGQKYYWHNSDQWVELLAISSGTSDSPSFASITLTDAYPASPATGEFGYSSTYKKHMFKDPMCPSTGVGARRTLYDAVADSGEISNTTSKSYFSGTYSIPASSLIVGSHIRVWGRGVYSTKASGAGTATFTGTFAAVDMAATAAITLTDNLTNQCFEIEMDFIVRAIASNLADIVANVKVTLHNGTTAMGTSNGVVSGTFNVTNAMTPQFAVQMSVADTGNKFKLQTSTVEVL